MIRDGLSSITMDGSPYSGSSVALINQVCVLCS
jgi:hypothetical protein